MDGNTFDAVNSRLDRVDQAEEEGDCLEASIEGRVKDEEEASV